MLSSTSRTKTDDISDLMAATGPVQTIRWQLCQSAEQMQERAVQMITESAEQAISERRAFHMVLAGGSSPVCVYRMLKGIKTDWQAWHVYFGDERCLPADDPERNSHMARSEWLDHVGIPAGQIHPIPAELGAQQGAVAYATTLQNLGEFDLVLLGLGDDGHTASLFPGREWGGAPHSQPVLAIQDAPKAPAERVSLSAWRLSNTRKAIFLITGESKRGAVSIWREGGMIPACSIKPASGVDVLVEQALCCNR